MDNNERQKKSCEKTKARKRALYLLGIKDYSRKELMDKLKHSYSEESAVYACDYIEQLGLLNDEVYARRLIKDFTNRKHFYGKRLEHELLKKGICKDLVDSLIDELEVDVIEEIENLIEFKYTKTFDDEKQMRRSVSALTRLGFKWDDIKEVLNKKGYYE